MPYKTPFGSHYHLKIGCNGAFIPCGTSGLEPCSVCCGRISGANASDAGAGGGSASAGTTGHGLFTSDEPSAEAGSPPPQGATPERHDIKPAQAPSLKAQSAPSADGHDISDLATRYAEMRRQFKGAVPPSHHEDAQESSASSLASDSQSQDATPEGLIHWFSSSHSEEELANDLDGNIRFELIKKIDARTDTMEFRYQKIDFRHKVQSEWNATHPEAPILVWSEKDRGYESESARGVLYRQGSALQSSHAYGPITYTVYDKATGKDVTDLIHHYDFATRQLKEQIQATENNAQLRIILARNQESGLNQAFAMWRENKRQQSQKRRYWAKLTELSEKEANQLNNEFKREMPEYNLPDLTPEEYQDRYSDEERAQLQQLQAKHDAMESRLGQALQDYGISQRTLFIIMRQYCRDFDTNSQEEYDPLS